MKQDLIFSEDLSTVTFFLPVELRTKEWQVFLSTIDNVLNGLRQQTKTVEFDFQNCIWCDPLPLLDLLITCKKIIDNKRRVIIIAPLFNEEENIASSRLYAFLYCEGFFKAFNSITAKIVNANKITISLNDTDTQYQKHLLFQDSLFIPPILVNIDDISQGNNTVAKWVREQINLTSFRLKTKIPTIHQTSVLSSLILFLTETISNSAEHAYNDNEIKYVAFYVRYRFGVTNTSLNIEQIKNLEIAFKKESENTPALSYKFAERYSGFLEVIVQDRGKGIVQSYNKTSKTKYPFQEALKQILHLGNRNLIKKKATEFGGLYILTRLINLGYLWMKDGNEVYGIELPIQSTPRDTEDLKSKLTTKGFSIIARISWKQSDEKIGWTEFASFKDHPYFQCLQEQTDIYHKYWGTNYKKLKSNPLYIRDNRFPFIQSDIYAKNYYKNTDADSYVLYLPDGQIEKNEIHRILENEFLFLQNPSKTLIVADIDQLDAPVYKYALENAIFKPEFCANIEKIILVTKNFLVLILSKHKLKGNFYSRDKSAEESYISTNLNTFSPTNCFQHLLHWLKTHDSIVYWRYMFKNLNSREYFLKGSIVWTQNQTKINLRIYYNFANTLSEKSLVELYNFLISRLKYFSQELKALVIATDSLVKNVVDVYNTGLDLKIEKPNYRILINSVWVTGMTLENAGLTTNDININFLENKSSDTLSKNSTLSNFLFWPDPEQLEDQIPETPGNIQRVGSSPYVAEGGWKYYTIPRYKHLKYSEIPIFDVIKKLQAENEQVVDHSFVPTTITSPVDMYREWQSFGSVSLGHFEYSGYHDFIKVDVPHIYDESQTLKSDLFLFILSEISITLGLEISKLNITNDFIEKLRRYRNKYSLNRKRNDEESYDFIVYPYHYATEHIIRQIKNFLGDENSKRIISLMPLQFSESNNPSFYSPQVIENLKNTVNELKLSNNNKIRVKVFDTVRVNGKTEKDIYHILKLCGVDVVNTIVLLDRQRLPLHGSDNNNFISYWRMDIPTLGGANNCSICQSVERLKYMKEYINNDIINDRINEIINIWKPVFRYTNHGTFHGVPSFEINLSNSGLKKYGVYQINGQTFQIGGEKNKIQITNSHGLTIYCLEMLSMTTKNDLILEFISENEISYSSIVESSCAMLLLFKNQLSRTTKKLLLNLLFEKTKDNREYSHHTALVLITLLSYLDFFGDANDTSFINSISNTEFIQNTDILVFVCALSVFSKHNFEISNQVRRSIANLNPKDIVLREFHRALFNDFGNNHDTALHLIKTNNQINYLIFREALGSIKFCRCTLEKYDLLHFVDATYDYRIETQIERIDLLIYQLTDISSNFANTTMREIEYYIFENKDILVKTFKEIYSNFLDLHSKIFTSFDFLYNINFRVRDDIERLCKLVQDQFNVKINCVALKPKKDNNNIYEKWIPWNRKTENIIKNILSDTRHTIDESRILTIESQGVSYHSVIYCEEVDTSYVLSFQNKISEQRLIKFEDSFSKKKRLEKMYLNSLGGDLEYCIKNCNLSLNEKILIVTIKLPFY